MTKQMTHNQIEHMSDDERKKHYEKEKDELFYHLKNMSAEEISARHEAIRKKWGV